MPRRAQLLANRLKLQLKEEILEMAIPPIEFSWCRSRDEALRLAELFATNLTDSYISHAELQSLRAINTKTWSPKIETILEGDLVSRIDQPLDAAEGAKTQLLVSGQVNGSDVAVFLVSFSRAAAVAYTEIEDMMVAADARGKGIGHQFMQWITQESMQRGIRRLFLESGIGNDHAHAFFDDIGFQKISVVMMKSLQ
jgi:GNAT superfamily N-acetyltransferase